MSRDSKIRLRLSLLVFEAISSRLELSLFKLFFYLLSIFVSLEGAFDLVVKILPCVDVLLVIESTWLFDFCPFTEARFILLTF